jgi:hypothetical protein
VNIILFLLQFIASIIGAPRPEDVLDISKVTRPQTGQSILIHYTNHNDCPDKTEDPCFIIISSGP